MLSKGLFEEASGFTKLFVLAFVVFFCMLLAMGLASIFMKLAENHLDYATILRISLLIQNITLFIGSSLIAAHLLWKGDFKSSLKLRYPGKLILVFGCFAILSAGPIINILAEWNEGLKLPESMKSVQDWMISSQSRAQGTMDSILNTTNIWDILLNILIVGVLAGIGEELIFRGVLQRILIEWTKNIHIGVIVTGIIFSAIHFQFFGFAPRVILGILLGYLFVLSKSLWVPIIAHAFNNTMYVLVKVFKLLRQEMAEGTNEVSDIATSTTESVDNSVWLQILSTLVMFWLLWMIYNRTNKQLKAEKIANEEIINIEEKNESE